MQTFIEVAQTISPLGVIALLVIIILYLVKNDGLLSILRGSRKTQELDANVIPVDKLEVEKILKHLIQIETNHLHELPAMKQSIDRIEKMQMSMIDEQVKQGNRITSVEAQLVFFRQYDRQ